MGVGFQRLNKVRPNMGRHCFFQILRQFESLCGCVGIAGSLGGVAPHSALNHQWVKRIDGSELQKVCLRAFEECPPHSAFPLLLTALRAFTNGKADEPDNAPPACVF
ncbi:MAG: hypothetical protein WEK74_16170, partial [Hydrogenophaga sp.]